MADTCGFKKCGWIIIKTDPPRREDFSTGPGKSLDKNTDESFVRRALATIQAEEQPGVVEIPDPELPPCGSGCTCRPIGKRPTKDEDYGDPWDQPVVVKVPAKAEVGDPLHPEPPIEVLGHVKKRMAELPGRCYRSVSKPAYYVTFTPTEA